MPAVPLPYSLLSLYPRLRLHFIRAMTGQSNEGPIYSRRVATGKIVRAIQTNLPCSLAKAL